MKIFRLIIILLYIMKLGYCKIKKLLVNGQTARIENLPYVAYLSIRSLDHDKAVYHMCGSSILNQNLILTAAHCICDYYRGSHQITIFVGHEIKHKGAASTAISVAVHEEHNEETLHADIGLVKSKTPFEFNSKVSRVAIMEYPPYNEVGLVAGWGLTDIEKKTGTKELLFTIQYYMAIQKNCECLMDQHLGKGFFCATSKGDSHVARGDSGSALVVQTYIQTGIVSYRLNNHSEENKNIGVYTDVGHYYEWIQDTTDELCDS